MARYFGHYNESMVPRAHLESLGYHPYAYGYPWETVVKSDFTEKTTKLYVHGRQSYEMSYVMPDQKTVYSTDDGTNCVFTMFKATTEKDIKEGTNWCMKMTQTCADGADAIDFTANVTWIEMPTPKHSEVAAAIKTTTFSDLFDYEACTGSDFAETCATAGFKTVNIGEGCECLKAKAGKEKLAAVFEKRRYAAYLGCTAEFRKWEGFTYDSATKKAYTAISSVEYGMEDNKDKRDYGSPNHIRIAKEKCGCVMEFDIDDDTKATQARMLTCGKASSDANPATAGNFKDSCDTGAIANPDNVATIPGARQVLLDSPRAATSS